MADDWAPGDLALCVDDDDNGCLGPAGWRVRIGGLYHVDAVVYSYQADEDGEDPIVLALKEDPDRATMGWLRRQFTKIKPLSDAERMAYEATLKSDAKLPVSEIV